MEPPDIQSKTSMIVLPYQESPYKARDFQFPYAKTNCQVSKHSVFYWTVFYILELIISNEFMNTLYFNTKLTKSSISNTKRNSKLQYCIACSGRGEEREIQST